MFVRRTQTRRSDSGETYHTHRLVRSERVGGKVRQRTLLNLGRHFDIEREHWPFAVRPRRRGAVRPGGAAGGLPAGGGARGAADRGATDRARGGAGGRRPARDIQAVDVDSLELARPRGVGAERVGLWALEQAGLPALLRELGIGRALRAAALGSIVGRMAFPASERATMRWLRERSGLGELLDVDFETMGAMRLYRASDALMAHREAIESHLFDRAMGLFDLRPTVTLYDLTNTFFEGEAKGQPLARRGDSKEKRGDCPLLTLGLVLDAGGFVRRSRVFAGNVEEAETLAGMLEALSAPKGALVVMDRGVATEDSVAWLRAEGYRYVVVSRERRRRFDAAAAVPVETRSKQTVRLHKEVSEDSGETRLYCYSEERAKKERGIVERFAKRFEKELALLDEGLSRPRTRKRLEHVWRRIGRLSENSRGVAQHYDIRVAADAAGEKAVAVTWTRRAVEGSMATHPGVYCLRSSEADWDEETLWRTYVTLTDLEAVFRSLKSELGLRPIYHHKPLRAEGHLFITVVAYQLVQIVRKRLRERGEHASWTTLRRVLAGQRRVTATFRRADGRAPHVRKATRAEPRQLAIYAALGVDPSPGGVQKTIV